MPLVLKEGAVELRVFYRDEHPLVHAFDGEMDNGLEVQITLDTLLVAGYGDGPKMPSGEFLLKALQLVHKNRELLLQAWEEINS